MRQIIAILTVFVIISCQPQKEKKAINTDSEKTIVEQTIKNSIAWAKTKDTSLLYSIIANDENYLEVHPEGGVVKGSICFPLTVAHIS